LRITSSVRAVAVADSLGCEEAPHHAAAGCGLSNATPPGSYNLTISASAAGLTRSVTVTLVVQ
jgi:hypothetical protein